MAERALRAKGPLPPQPHESDLEKDRKDRTVNRKFRMRSENGQTMTEFALVLPILALFLFGVIQGGIVFNNYLTVTDAARAGARKGAVSMYGGGDPAAAAEAAARDSADNLDDGELDVDVTASPSWETGSNVTVTVSYPYEVSLVGLVVASGDVESSTTERIE
jgi:Flp pilus assembly protein TadG